jgi:hypothetical protein
MFATLDYLELTNLSSEPVPLFDPASPSSTWRLEGTVEYSFPGGMTLDPGECVVLVGFDPDGDVWTLISFLENYGLDYGTEVFGPHSGTLGDSRGRIVLLEPDSSILPGSSGTENVPYVVMDEVEYRSSYPWPEDANGTGKSLQRIVGEAYGNDPLNWQAASPTPMAIDAEGGDLDVDADGLPNHWESACGLNPWIADGDDGASGDPDGDGLTNIEEYRRGTHPRDATNPLCVRSISKNAASVVVEFVAAAGKSYSILYLDNLSSGDWLKLEDVLPQAETGLVEVHDPTSDGVGSRFYRIVTPAVP